MRPHDYIKGALATEPCPDEFNKGGDLSGSQIRLLHAAMGLCTEAGEVMDAIKKHLFYGAELDETNLIEEAGDVLWYLAIMMDELSIGFHGVMQINHDKLAKRYGEKFSSEAALHRDLEGERNVLEGKKK